MLNSLGVSSIIVVIELLSLDSVPGRAGRWEAIFRMKHESLLRVRLVRKGEIRTSKESALK